MLLNNLTKYTLQELKDLQKTLEKEVGIYDIKQKSTKICANSCYGNLGSEYARLYNLHHATAITMSGQLSIKWISNKLNEYLNGIFQTKDIDFVVASDTDSSFLNLSMLVEKFLPNETDNQKIVDWLDRICRERIEPFIDEQYSILSRNLNARTNCLKMKRESISERALWMAKKRYILSVYDDEGVRYLNEPKIKISGIEAVKSSTPSACRKKIKDAITLIMTKSESEVQKFILDFEEEFSKTPLIDIAFPRGVSNLEKYADSRLIYRKGTPIHVRGCLLFNRQLKRKGLANQYEKIKSGDKIRFVYLRVPNPIDENVVGFVDVLPREFDLDKYIDYDIMFEKSFIEPLKSILEKMGWNPRKFNSLDKFFS